MRENLSHLCVVELTLRPLVKLDVGRLLLLIEVLVLWLNLLCMFECEMVASVMLSKYLIEKERVLLGLLKVLPKKRDLVS